VTAAQRHARAQTPAAWAPFRGLKFGTHQLTGDFWVTDLVLAVLFAGTVVCLARHAAQRRANKWRALSQ
jgi:hypothetical protein